MVSLFNAVCSGPVDVRAPGDLVYLEVLGNSTLFVNSYEVAVDLLDKKSAITSTRSYTTMLCEL